jgi:hypothetical protein
MKFSVRNLINGRTKGKIWDPDVGFGFRVHLLKILFEILF